MGMSPTTDADDRQRESLEQAVKETAGSDAETTEIDPTRSTPDLEVRTDDRHYLIETADQIVDVAVSYLRTDEAQAADEHVITLPTRAHAKEVIDQLIGTGTLCRTRVKIRYGENRTECFNLSFSRGNRSRIYESVAGRFLSAELEESPGEKLDADDFVERFITWYQNTTSEKPPNRTWANRSLRACGIEIESKAGKEVVVGWKFRLDIE